MIQNVVSSISIGRFYVFYKRSCSAKWGDRTKATLACVNVSADYGDQNRQEGGGGYANPNKIPM